MQSWDSSLRLSSQPPACVHEAAEAAEGVIDKRRPAGSVGRIEEMHSGKPAPVCGMERWG